MAQFSRLVSQIDALLDELVAARGDYATLGAAIEAKAGEEDLAEIAEALDAVDAALAGKITYSTGTAIAASEGAEKDLDGYVDTGTFYAASAAVPYILNAPKAPNGALNAFRMDVLATPSRRTQIIRPNGDAAYIFVRNSTSAPAPVTASLIPAMTSATTPSGTVIESGHFETRYGYLAFDGVDSQTWQSHSWSDGTNILDGTPEKCFVGYLWDSPQTVASVKITFSSDRQYTACVQCRIGGEWQTVLDSVTIAGSGYSTYEQSLGGEINCDGIRLCVLTGAEERFSSSVYGGNVCEFIAYGAGGMAASWGPWYNVNEHGLALGIAQNSDFDDYMQPGAYYCGATTSATIAHNPYPTGAVKLYVEYLNATNRYIQKLIPAKYGSFQIYYRQYTNQGWGAWYLFEGTEVVTASTNNANNALLSTIIEKPEETS